jgi:hypothetical protein
MKEDGSVLDQFGIANREQDWIKFKDRYLSQENQIGLEISRSGKYVAEMLINMGFQVHVMNPSKFPQIFQTVKKNDRDVMWIRNKGD